jgi:putative endonuclease
MTSGGAPPGFAAEDLVARTLVARGWSVLERNLRIGKLEIDLLVRLGDVIAIVEVRGRRVDGWSEPFDTIDRNKQRRLAAAARGLWSRRFAKDRSVRVVRIDLAAVTWMPDEDPKIEIVEGAVDPNLR